MKLGVILRKYQVWLSAAVAAVSLELIVLLSSPASSLAAGDDAVAAEPALTSLGLPVGAIVILTLLIGSRALRRVRQQDDATFCPPMPTEV